MLTSALRAGLFTGALGSWSRRLSAGAGSIVALFFWGALLAHPRSASASEADELLVHPRLELDPRFDLHEEVAPARPGGPLRAPLSIGIGVTYGATQGTTTSLTSTPGFGVMLLLGLPFERLGGGSPRTAFAEGPAGVEPEPSLKPVPRGKIEPLPPAPAKLAPEGTAPLRIPVVVTPAAAREAVDAALRRAGLAEPGSRVEALATRARRAAALPELRLRALRTLDTGDALSPTSYDPYRITQTTGASTWLEARATWKLDRLVFADEEVALERMRHDRAEAQARLTKHVLEILFAWQKALALADNPSASPEESLSARLKALEAEVELDLLTGGWFVRWRALEAARAPAPLPPPPKPGR